MIIFVSKQDLWSSVRNRENEKVWKFHQNGHKIYFMHLDDRPKMTTSTIFLCLHKTIPIILKSKVFPRTRLPTKGYSGSKADSQSWNLTGFSFGKAERGPYWKFSAWKRERKLVSPFHLNELPHTSKYNCVSAQLFHWRVPSYHLLFLCWFPTWTERQQEMRRSVKKLRSSLFCFAVSRTLNSNDLASS